MKINGLPYGVLFRFNLEDGSGVSTTRIKDVLTINKSYLRVNDIIKLEGKSHLIKSISISDISEYLIDYTSGLDPHSNDRLDRDYLFTINIELTNSRDK